MNKLWALGQVAGIIALIVLVMGGFILFILAATVIASLIGMM